MVQYEINKTLIVKDDSKHRFMLEKDDVIENRLQITIWKLCCHIDQRDDWSISLYCHFLSLKVVCIIHEMHKIDINQTL